MAILYATPVFFVLRLDEVNDLDLWWHLRIGQWIVQHGAIPRVEMFSTFGAGTPWVAYSWLFELIVFGLFQKLGLVGIVVYSSTMAVLIGATVHNLVRRSTSDFTLGVGITFFAMFTMGRLFMPRPWLLSIFFFALELNVLMRARETGKIRDLLLLPLLFTVWTNVHIQFVDGLVVLGIVLAESVIAQRWSSSKTNLQTRTMVGISLACVAATLLNPYGWTIYKIAYDLVTQTASLQITEFSAISFRTVDDWCLVFIAFGATIVLARARRFAFFETMLLVAAVIISFRSQRDIWFLTIVGSFILASGSAQQPVSRTNMRGWEILLTTSATVLYVWMAFIVMRANNPRLQATLEKDLPVRAMETIRQQGWSGPIYNDFNWGGFLIWSLNRPVALYGRNTDHGVDRVIRSTQTWNGAPGWDSDVELLKANLIIAQPGVPLVQLLQFQPCLRLAYADRLAAVFIPQKDQTGGAGTVATSFCTRREELSKQPTQ